MRTLTLSMILMSLVASQVFADPTSKLQKIKEKVIQGIELTTEEASLLEKAEQIGHNEVIHTEERGLAEVKLDQDLKSNFNIGLENIESETLIEVLDENDATKAVTPKTNVSIKDIEKQKPLVDNSKNEPSFIDKAKALLLGPPLLVADKAVKTVKKVHNANISAGTKAFKQVGSNIKTTLGFIRDNYNTIQAISRDYADLNPVTKSLNDFRIKLSNAGINIALLSNPLLVKLYKGITKDKATQKEKDVTLNKSVDTNKIKEEVANLSKEELIGLILSQEIKLGKNDLPIKKKVSDFSEDITFEELEEIYAQNVAVLEKDMDAIATKDKSEINDELYPYGDVDEYGRKITNLEEVVVTAEPLTEKTIELNNDTASCESKGTEDVLSAQIAELKSSFEKFQSEQSELNSALMQTMAMNNLLMTQNNLMMSQMLMMQNMMMMQNQIGERKGSLDDLIDSHYKNYMAAPSNGQYDPNAVNNTPFASNYLPQTQFENNAFQSPSFYSVGPSNSMYSPGYNFSFGNTFDQPRQGPTHAELAEIFKVTNPLFVQSSNG